MKDSSKLLDYKITTDHNFPNKLFRIGAELASQFELLRDVGVGYGDYLEQLTYLLFLKMADEYSKPPYNRQLNIPEKYNWKSLTAVKGAELELHYAVLLRKLRTQKGISGQIFMAEDIIENLEADLESFRTIMIKLNTK